jgi:hypothetical protein
MSHITIRFNKSRGQSGRGSLEHVWRVFVDGQEYLFKHFKINVPSVSEKEPYSEDWNIACEGILHIDRDTSTAIINGLAATLESN